MYLEYWRAQGLPADVAVEDVQLQGDAGGGGAASHGGATSALYSCPLLRLSAELLLLLASEQVLNTRRTSLLSPSIRTAQPFSFGVPGEPGSMFPD